MSRSRPGRKSKPYSASDRLGLSSDAKVLRALLRQQPQNLQTLCKNAGISRRTWYRVKPILVQRGIIKKVGDRYALFGFLELEEIIEKALGQIRSLEDEIRANTECVKLAGGVEVIRTKAQSSALKRVMTSQELASEVGMPWDDIKKTAYDVAKKLGLQVQLGRNGMECFQKKDSFTKSKSP